MQKNDNSPRLNEQVHTLCSCPESQGLWMDIFAHLISHWRTDQSTRRGMHINHLAWNLVERREEEKVTDGNKLRLARLRAVKRSVILI